MDSKIDACVIAMDVNARQKYLFETDKLQEILGASRIIVAMKEEAEKFFKEEDGIHLFSPVSGEIKVWALLTCRDLLLDRSWELRLWMEEHGLSGSAAYLETYSAHFLKNGDEFSEKTHEDPGPDSPDLAWVHWALEEILREQKDGMAGEDNRPTSSLFAECRIHGSEPANIWLTGKKAENTDERRRLVGWRAKAKQVAWENGSVKIFSTLADAIKPGIEKKPVELERACKAFTNDVDKFIESSGDSYIAYACGDGDGMGEILSNLHWNNDDKWQDHSSDRKPWERNRDFVMEYDSLVSAAFKAAVSESVWIPKEIGKVNILPQLLGGDDVWMVGARDAIADLCPRFVNQYETLTESGEAFKTLRSALAVAKAHRLLCETRTGTGSGKPSLRFTMSMGIAFCKAGFPLNKAIVYAENLMKEAKTLRKNLPQPTGCIDWYWVESSKFESIREARRQSLMYTDAPQTTTFNLTTRPWTHEEFSTFVEAAESFQCVPRGKREQLEEILRMGGPLGDLAWLRWKNSLTKQQWELCRTTKDKLPVRFRPNDLEKCGWCNAGFPNRERYTPFLDILALQHVFGLEGSKEQEETKGEGL